MTTSLTTRLDELRRERSDGLRQLERLEAQRQALRDTLLRISGAIRVLEELSAEPSGDGAASRPEPDSP